MVQCSFNPITTEQRQHVTVNLLNLLNQQRYKFYPNFCTHCDNSATGLLIPFKEKSMHFKPHLTSKYPQIISLFRVTVDSGTEEAWPKSIVVQLFIKLHGFKSDNHQISSIQFLICSQMRKSNPMTSRLGQCRLYLKKF